MIALSLLFSIIISLYLIHRCRKAKASRKVSIITHGNVEPHRTKAEEFLKKHAKVTGYQNLVQKDPSPSTIRDKVVVMCQVEARLGEDLENALLRLDNMCSGNLIIFFVKPDNDGLFYIEKCQAKQINLKELEINEVKVEEYLGKFLKVSRKEKWIFLWWVCMVVSSVMVCVVKWNDLNLLVNGWDMSKALKYAENFSRRFIGEDHLMREEINRISLELREISRGRDDILKLLHEQKQIAKGRLDEVSMQNQKMMEMEAKIAELSRSLEQLENEKQQIWDKFTGLQEENRKINEKLTQQSEQRIEKQSSETSRKDYEAFNTRLVNVEGSLINSGRECVLLQGQIGRLEENFILLNRNVTANLKRIQEENDHKNRKSEHLEKVLEEASFKWSDFQEENRKMQIRLSKIAYDFEQIQKITAFHQ